MKKPLILVPLLLIMVGCGSSVRSHVDNAFRPGYELRGKSVYAYYAKEEGRVSLNEEEYLRMMNIALQRSGMILEADSREADVILAFELTAGEPHFFTYTVPVFDTTGGTSYYSGRITGGANGTRTYSGTRSEPYRRHYAGSYTRQGVAYTHNLFLYAFEKTDFIHASDPNRKIADIPMVWEGSVLSTGSSSSLPQIAPFLIHAMETYFGQDVHNVIVRKKMTSSFKPNHYSR